MTRRTPPRATAALALGVALAACRSGATAQTPAPSPAPAAAPATQGRTAAGNVAADVRFMQRMIGHHAQALDMAALVPARSRRDDLKLLAERITVSQQDEIAMMRRWLRAKGEPAPDTADHAAMDHSKMDHSKMDHAAMDHASEHAMHHDAMPGMATPAEMAALATLAGPAFDARFLDLMIRHHEGALTMVAELFGSQGAAQDPAVFGFATDVDADQRAEIARMRALRARLSNE